MSIEIAELKLIIAKINLQVEKLSLEVKKLYEEIKVKKVKEEVIEEEDDEEEEKEKGYDEGLVQFLKSGKFKFGKDNNEGTLYCREKLFIKAYNEFCDEFDYPQKKSNEKLYSNLFDLYEINIEKNSSKRYPNVRGAKTYGGTFLIGLDFKTMDEIKEEEENTLVKFLKSGRFNFGKDNNGNNLYCPEKLVKEAYNDFCDANNYPPVKWTSLLYNGPFSMFDIQLNRDSRKRYPNVPGAEIYGGCFLIGLDFKED